MYIVIIYIYTYMATYDGWLFVGDLTSTFGGFWDVISPSNLNDDFVGKWWLRMGWFYYSNILEAITFHELENPLLPTGKLTVCYGKSPLFIIPSGKHTKNYGKIHRFQWVNPLFQWPCSSSQTVDITRLGNHPIFLDRTSHCSE